MIAKGFGFTRDFLKKLNNSAYCQLKKIPGGFKEQARARHPGKKCGLQRMFKRRCKGYEVMGYKLTGEDDSPTIQTRLPV
jgi:hypothetical protein